MTKKLFDTAKQYIPGGVNSPVRAFHAVGGEPVFISSGRGACLYDSNDRQYTDYVGSWGAMILGHAHPEVIKAVQERSAQGLSFGAPTQIETAMAKKICHLMPSIEKVRMVNSGTEACMSAIRLARGVTGRDKIIKFEGCYHGHVDPLMVKAGSGMLTLGQPTSAGIPETVIRHTLTLDYNDVEQVKAIFKQIGGDIAAVIVEPVAGNMNCVPATQEFLDTLRQASERHGSVLIFDEVMSGFRVAAGGAQSIYKIKPDITVLGKIIGGGMPVGAFGGRREIMDQIAPAGPVYQAGTLSGNPVAMNAGLRTLELIDTDDFFARLGATTRLLTDGLQEQADAAGIPFTTHAIGGMFGFFFSKESPVRTYAQVMNCDQERFKQFFRAMLEHGIYLAPSPFEAGFVSAAHNRQIIEQTIDIAGEVMRQL